MYIQNGVLGIISKIKNKFIIFSSMRVQLFATLFLVSVLSLIVLAVGIMNDHRSQSINNRVAQVQIYCKQLATQMVLTSYLSGVNQAEVNTEMNLAANLNSGRILVVDGGLNIVFDSFNREVGKILIAEEVIKCLKGNNTIYRDSKNQYVEITFPLTNIETKEVLGVIIMNFSLANEYNLTHVLEMNTIIMLITITVLLFTFSFFYARKMARPLKEIVKSIDHVAEGYMEDTIGIRGYREINRICDSFNEMLNQMKNLENSRQEFVSNVSHELKTPMTSMKVLADSLIQLEDAPVDLYREFMSDINEEIERENKIINDLLSLVKNDKNTGEMHITQIEINELLEVILKRLKPIAKNRNVDLVFESFRQVIAEVDEVKISLAISNLIENAIKYNVDDGWVRVSLNADHKYFFIKVSDSGIGIPEESKSQIFDRFYRVDKARSRQTGGTGLGLSITKNVVLMHNGAIKVTSKENEGTTFTMRIPLSHII